MSETMQKLLALLDELRLRREQGDDSEDTDELFNSQMDPLWYELTPEEQAEVRKQVGRAWPGWEKDRA